MFGMQFGIIPQRPEFVAYAETLKARPALQRSKAKDAEVAASMK